jgi:hypothetical protein
LNNSAADIELLTAPATPEACRWTDWSSQLAPGHEQWLIAIKPSPLTDAAQVLAHGTGLFNIGATRVPRGGVTSSSASAGSGSGQSSENVYGDGLGGVVAPAHPGGSWPKNVVLSEGGEHCPVAELDRQSGVLTSGSIEPHHVNTGGQDGQSNSLSGPNASRTGKEFKGDTGGASRFFTRFRYQAKNSDRTAGMRTDIINNHSTPKSLELMCWIVRLLAAKAEHTGGLPAIVLDPFMGSGSTGVACIHERVRFIGIERDPVPDAPVGAVQSFHIARARIMAAIGSPEAAAEANELAPTGGQLSLL